MQLAQLKLMIETKQTLPTTVFEITNENEEFLINQYIEMIIKNNNYELIEDDLKKLKFYDTQNNSNFYVFKTEELNTELELPNCFISCKKDNTKKAVKIGKIENWMIEDYIQGITELNKESTQLICKSYEYNLKSLYNESLKYIGLDKHTKCQVFNENKSQYFVAMNLKQAEFELVNALLNKDRNKIVEIVAHKDQFDLNAYAVYIMLYKKIHLIVDILLNKNSSAASLGISPKQYNFIQYSYSKTYTKDELEYKISGLSKLEFKLKSGTCVTDLLDEILILFQN